MKVLVDTCIWSLAFRRNQIEDKEVVSKLKQLILDSNVQIIGPIRQELLSGIQSQIQFHHLKNYLSSFPDLLLETKDYELAAEYYNLNRKKGIQGSNTDFLLCAVSFHHKIPVYTVDKDFLLYIKNVPFSLYKK